MFRIYYHNVSGFKKVDEGLVLEKFNPIAFDGLSEKGKGNIHSFHGSELRFCIEEPIELVLGSFGTSELMIYYGDYQGELYTFANEITLKISPKFKESDIKKLLPFHRFHPSVIRVIFKESLIIKSLKGQTEIPDRRLMPNKKYLAYGTSITQGRSSFLPDINYPLIIGEKLAYDTYNMGMSGSCYIEKILVDQMLMNQFDLITLELSVNMIGDGFGVDVFEERLFYLLSQIEQTQKNCLVIGMSVLDNWRMYGFDQNRGHKTDVLAFRDCFKAVISRFPNFIYIDGKDVLSKHHLSYDLIHPGHYGMIEIANHIINVIEKTL
ncbi:MAG: SGNH/GDSL hydrolase family protein [Acholeplasma sp.]|nr:SGNH/GDSL hydrolase family protein [Acholeplasma sp.]